MSQPVEKAGLEAAKVKLARYEKREQSQWEAFLFCAGFVLGGFVVATLFRCNI